jgi:hypothetical protein
MHKRRSYACWWLPPPPAGAAWGPLIGPGLVQGPWLPTLSFHQPARAQNLDPLRRRGWLLPRHWHPPRQPPGRRRTQPRVVGCLATALTQALSLATVPCCVGCTGLCATTTAWQRVGGPSACSGWALTEHRPTHTHTHAHTHTHTHTHTPTPLGLPALGKPCIHFYHPLHESHGCAAVSVGCGPGPVSMDATKVVFDYPTREPFWQDTPSAFAKGAFTIEVRDPAWRSSTLEGICVPQRGREPERVPVYVRVCVRVRPSCRSPPCCPQHPASPLGWTPSTSGTSPS